MARGVLCSALSLLLAACGDRDALPGAVGGETAEPGGTAILAELADMNTPNVLLAATLLDGALAFNILNMALLRGSWSDGRVEYLTADESPMALARSYEYPGPDSTALRFHIRSDARWSDGTPVTAHDVVFTYRLVQDPALATPRRDFVQHLDSVVANSDTVVTFHYNRRYPEMLTHTTLNPLPRHVYEGTDAAQFRNHSSISDPAGKLVTSGPFRIGQWERGQRVVLVPNQHFQPRPHLNQIVIRIIPETTTRLVELQTGGVDFVQNVPYDQIARLRQQAPHLRWEVEERRFFDYIAYNPEQFEPFGDPEIRRALGMAIEVDGMIRGLQMEGHAEQAASAYSPLFPHLQDRRLTQPLPHDPEGARRILESKGWRDTNGDGILDRDGRPFRFTLITNAESQRRRDAMQIAQQQWRSIGVDAQLQTLEFNTFMEGLQRRTYQAALGGWQVSLTPDLTQLWGDTPLNITGYRNPEVDRLFGLAQQQPTPEAAAPYWRQAGARLFNDQPYTWLYYMDAVDGVNERLRGMKIDAYSPYQNSWEWWIPADRQGGAAARPTAN